MLGRLKYFFDTFAIGGVVCSALGWFPAVLAAIASIFAIVWYILQIITWFKTKKALNNGD